MVGEIEKMTMKRIFVSVAIAAMIFLNYHVCRSNEYRSKVNGGNPQSISLSGRLPSDIEIVEVTWSNNKGGSGIASGTTNWTISDIALTCCDDNIITVYAKDSEGNIIHTSYITVDVATSIAPSKNSEGNIGTDILTDDVAPSPPTGLKIND